MEIALINVGVLLASILIGLVYDYVFSSLLVPDDKKVNRNRMSAFKLSRHLPLIIINILTLCVLSLVGITLFQHCFNSAWPSFSLFFSQFLLILVLDDMEFYFWHRFLHKNAFMMKRIHAIHHRARVPYPIEFIYVHPIEWLGGTLGIVAAFILIVLFHGSVNAYVVWAYSAYRTLREMDSHSNLNAFLVKKIPFFCSATHHAVHHTKLRGNYASTFTYLDKLFGTSVKEN